MEKKLVASRHLFLELSAQARTDDESVTIRGAGRKTVERRGCTGRFKHSKAH